MRWYLPSWNGDVRAEQDPEDEARTKVTIIEPTPNELMLLGRLEHQLRQKGWYDAEEPMWQVIKDGRRKAAKRQEVLVAAPLSKVAPLLVENYKAGKQTLTAIIYRDGDVETVDGTEGSTALAKAADKAVRKKAKKAATVKRATPCCPQCEAGSIEPASEVLLDFLDERQHADWRDHRYIRVRGGRTGHEYVLAHRHSPLAVRLGRICWDASDRTILHFHDNTVPPEEEVLGAMLVLRHREHWLRNEATCIQGRFDRFGNEEPDAMARQVLDNPFGDYLDGVEDAGITQTVGSFMMGLLNGTGVSPSPDWWLEDVGKHVERWLDDLGDEIGISDHDGDGLLDDDERDFMAAAKQMADHAPAALPSIVLYWRRLALGRPAPDLEGVLS